MIEFLLFFWLGFVGLGLLIGITYELAERRRENKP